VFPWRISKLQGDQIGRLFSVGIFFENADATLGYFFPTVKVEKNNDKYICLWAGQHFG
jgi:hypothetical protein